MEDDEINPDNLCPMTADDVSYILWLHSGLLQVLSVEVANKGGKRKKASSIVFLTGKFSREK